MEKIEYEIKYSKIKNIYIQIKDGKVIIKAPRRVSKKEIEKILEQKSEWIQKTIEKERKKQEKKPLYTKEKFKEIVEKHANGTHFAADSYQLHGTSTPGAVLARMPLWVRIGCGCWRNR